MPAPRWLTERPVAHRGLHDAARGVIENTPGAIEAAISQGFAIEVDVQDTADGVPVVFHDATLDRLTGESGTLIEHSVSEIQSLPISGTHDRIPTLDGLLEQVGDRVPLLIEIKTDFSGSPAFAGRVAERIDRYKGRAALMSFDPVAVAAVRSAAPDVLRGITAEGYRNWLPDNSSRFRRDFLRHVGPTVQSRPQFVAYSVDDLPALAPATLRKLFGAPTLTWTVRTEEQRRRAARHADQIIFEGFVP